MTFWEFAPFCAPGRGDPKPPPSGAPDQDLPAAGAEAPARILIVEDNWLVAIECESALVDAGYVVVGVAVSADEAVAICEEERPDLVLMDIRLHGERDGVDAALEIRQRFEIPSVFLSAHQDAEIRGRAQAARPLGWIVKPVSNRTLLDELAKARERPH